MLIYFLNFILLEAVIFAISKAFRNITFSQLGYYYFLYVYYA